MSKLASKSVFDMNSAERRAFIALYKSKPRAIVGESVLAAVRLAEEIEARNADLAIAVALFAFVCAAAVAACALVIPA